MTSARAPKIQTVRLTSGEIRLTWPGTLTELRGADISADAVQICLGPEDAPGVAPLSPDVLTPQTTTVAEYVAQGGTNPFNLPPTQKLYQLVVQMFIGSGYVTPIAGSYWVWARLPDESEVEWFRFHKVVIS